MVDDQMIPRCILGCFISTLENLRIPKLFTVLLAIIILTPLIAGCGNGMIKVDLAFKTVEETYRNGHRVIDVKGTSNLPRGAYIHFEVESADPGLEQETPAILESGLIPIQYSDQGGYWVFTIMKVSEFLPGQYKISVVFDISDDQPPEAVKIFGQNGERIGGPHSAPVAEGSQNRKAEIETTITVE